MTDELKTEVLEVASRFHLCVLATVNSESAPEAAIVGFSVDQDLEVLFGTSKTTRKYANLQQNPRVAITIGDYKAEIQYEGTAKEIDLHEAEQRFGATPGIEKYREDLNQTWWLTTPQWLRLTVHETPNRVVEARLA